MSCQLCLQYLGVSKEHTLCPLRTSITCRRCLHTGHLTKECADKGPHWERPTSLEELIPAGVRYRYGITTRTPIDFDEPGDEGLSRELPDCNVLFVADDYEALGDFIKKHSIIVDAKITKDSKEERRRAVKQWSVQRGYRIVMQKMIQKATAVAAN